MPPTRVALAYAVMCKVVLQADVVLAIATACIRIIVHIALFQHPRD